MGLTSVGGFWCAISFKGQFQDLGRRRDSWLWWLQDGVPFWSAARWRGLVEIFPVRALAGDGERLAFLDLVAERLVLGGQVLDPFGRFAEVLIQGQD
jgi:hypothetical protein